MEGYGSEKLYAELIRLLEKQIEASGNGYFCGVNRRRPERIQQKTRADP
jgi:hypothetical protein